MAAAVMSIGLMRLSVDVLLILEMPFLSVEVGADIDFLSDMFGPTVRAAAGFPELLSSPQPAVDLSCVVHLINAAEPIDATSLDAFEVRASLSLARFLLSADFSFSCGGGVLFSFAAKVHDVMTSRCVEYKENRIVVTAICTLGCLLLDDFAAILNCEHPRYCFCGGQGGKRGRHVLARCRRKHYI